MRVLFLSGDAPDIPDQGDRIRAHCLLRALTEAHETYLLTAGERAPDRSAGVIAACREAVHVPVSRRQMLSGVAAHPGLPITVAARAVPAVGRAVYDLVSRHRIDLVYAYQHRMVPHAWGLERTRVVADLTDSLWLYRRRMAAVSPFPQRVMHLLEAARLRRFEAAVLQRAALTVLASREDAAVVEALAPGARVAVVPNGIDVRAYADPGPVPDEPVLLFTGHMGYPPNVDGVLAFYREAFPAIARAEPGVRLLVVGKDPAPAVAGLGTDSRVTVTGAVPDMRPYLRQASVVICPLRFGSGTRIKILEAMAAHRPVVSTAIGCEGLAVTPGRELEVVDSPAAMAAPVIRLLQDGDRRMRLATAGRALVRSQYDYGAIGTAMLARIKEAVRS